MLGVVKSVEGVEEVLQGDGNRVGMSGSQVGSAIFANFRDRVIFTPVSAKLISCSRIGSDDTTN